MLAKKNRKYGFVPASYVVEIAPGPSPDGTSNRTGKSITRLEEVPMRLLECNFLPTYDSNSKGEMHVSSAAEDAETTIPQPQELNRLGWDCESETEKLDSLGDEPDLGICGSRKINNRFSWCSNDSEQFITATGNQSHSIPQPASLRNWEIDNLPRYQLVDDGVPDGLPILHSPGQPRGMRRPSKNETPFVDESSSRSRSTKPLRFVTQQDTVANDSSIIKNAYTPPPLGAQVQFLLDSFSSICLRDDPEKTMTYPNPKSAWAKIMSILPLP